MYLRWSSESRGTPATPAATDACTPFDFLSSHTGDSFSPRAPRKNTIAGTALDQNTAFHAVSLADSVVAGSFGPPSACTTATPTREQNSMPTTSMNWNMPAPLPRFAASRHSARYIGTTTPISPAAIP